MCAVAAIAAITTQWTAGAEQVRPSSSASPAPAPTWTRVAHFADGRVFVTDENLALDTAFAKPVTLPTETVSSAWLQSFLATAQPHEWRLRDLTRRIQGTTPVYSSPTGMLLNPKYVDYLRHALGEEPLRFRANGTLDPVQIIFNGAAVGAFMPMKP
jgi:hypothetical protein